MPIPSENNVYGFNKTLSKTRTVLDAKKANGEQDVFFALMFRSSSNAGPNLEGKSTRFVSYGTLGRKLTLRCETKQNISRYGTDLFSASPTSLFLALAISSS